MLRTKKKIILPAIGLVILTFASFFISVKYFNNYSQGRTNHVTEIALVANNSTKEARGQLLTKPDRSSSEINDAESAKMTANSQQNQETSSAVPSEKNKKRLMQSIQKWEKKNSIPD